MHRLIVFLSLIICVQTTGADTVNPVHHEESLVFQSLNRYASSITDIERVDDTRSLVSEMLYAETSRLTSPLTLDERRKIIRIKEQVSTLNTFRISLVDTPENKTGLDLIYRYNGIGKSQITDHSQPNLFNDVTLAEYGAGFQKWFWSNRVFLRGVYKYAIRQGVIENFPGSDEYLDTYDLNTAIRINNISTNKLFTIYPSFVYQDIVPEISTHSDRKRQIASLGFTYGKELDNNDVMTIFSIDGILERRFDPRGLHLYGGYVRDTETFDGTGIIREDFFTGMTFEYSELTVAVQPTFFTYKVENDPSRDNSQLRTNVNLIYQIANNTVITFPLRYDVAVDGPEDYDNWKVGTEIQYVNVTYRDSNKTGLINSWYVSLRYDHQSFFKLDKNTDLLRLLLKLEI